MYNMSSEIVWIINMLLLNDTGVDPKHDFLKKGKSKSKRQKGSNGKPATNQKPVALHSLL